VAALSGSSNTTRAVTIVAPTQQQLAAVRTPAMANANRKNNAGKSGASSVSDGLTTAGSLSTTSASLSAPGTAHSPASSASSRKSAESSAASTPVAPRAVKPTKAAAVKAAVTAAAVKNVLSDRILRVYGTSDLSAALAGAYPEARRGAGAKSAISADFKVNWDAMKRFNGWKCIYWRQSDAIEVYVVPGRDKEPVANLIEVSLLALASPPLGTLSVTTYSALIVSLEPGFLAQPERAGPAHSGERVPAAQLGADLGAPVRARLEAPGVRARHHAVLLL
jgi:hypothetical protein